MVDDYWCRKSHKEWYRNEIKAGACISASSRRNLIQPRTKRRLIKLEIKLKSVILKNALSLWPARFRAYSPSRRFHSASYATSFFIFLTIHDQLQVHEDCNAPKRVTSSVYAFAQ